MLAFHPIRLEDKAEAEACLFKQNYRLCEHCFTDLFIWKDHYNTQICIHEGYLLIKMETFPDKTPMYLAPIGSGDLKKVMLDLEADAAERGIPFTLCCIPEDMIQEFEAVLPGYYVISDYIDGADYIYDVNKMATLSGKNCSPSGILSIASKRPMTDVGPMKRSPMQTSRRPMIFTFTGHKTVTTVRTA